MLCTKLNIFSFLWQHIESKPIYTYSPLKSHDLFNKKKLNKYSTSGRRRPSTLVNYSDNYAFSAITTIPRPACAALPRRVLEFTKDFFPPDVKKKLGEKARKEKASLLHACTCMCGPHCLYICMRCFFAKRGCERRRSSVK